MTDPTPEERALQIVTYTNYQGPLPDGDARAEIAAEIRAAEAAMQERCAKLAEDWEYSPGTPNSVEGGYAATVIAAAIRALGAKEPKDQDQARKDREFAKLVKKGTIF